MTSNDTLRAALEEIVAAIPHNQGGTQGAIRKRAVAALASQPVAAQEPVAVKPLLPKRPFAFAVRRAPENGVDQWRLFMDESEARAEAEQLDGEYEALFRVGDRRDALSALDVKADPPAPDWNAAVEACRLAVTELDCMYVNDERIEYGGIPADPESAVYREAIEKCETAIRALHREAPQPIQSSDGGVERHAGYTKTDPESGQNAARIAGIKLGPSDTCHDCGYREPCDMKCPNCNDANEYGDYEGPTCVVCGGTGRIVGPPDLLKAMERECWSLRCIDIPTGGGDADVGWEVVTHHMAKPFERVVAFGNTPSEALVLAVNTTGGTAQVAQHETI